MNISKKLFRVFLGFYLISSINIQTHYVDVIELIEEIILLDHFYNALSSKKPTVIKLYSQHCPYCKTFEKPFKEAAKKYNFINFLSMDGKKLNAAQHIKKYTHDQIKIPGYPSILFIKNSKIIDYLIGGEPKKFEEKIKKLAKQ